jgi:anti-sigma factor RsiW
MSLDDTELSALLRRQATRHVATEGLRAGIRTQIALAEAGRAAAPRRALEPWRTGAAGFALGVLVTVLLGLLLQRGPADAGADVELVQAHVRALRLGPLVEVVSGDRHTVKPWFQGRLDYAPPVIDLAAEGFVLEGGRVDYLGGPAVAALSYRRDRHVIDVFVWPDAAAQAPAHSVYRGYHVVHGAAAGMQFRAVSDLERTELERFARLWLERAGRP